MAHLRGLAIAYLQRLLDWKLYPKDVQYRKESGEIGCHRRDPFRRAPPSQPFFVPVAEVKWKHFSRERR